MMRCAGLLLVAGVAPLLAADAPVVFRSDVSLVRVDAQVVGRDNHAITGLRAEDFILRDEGQPQPIRNFGTENLPVDVVLLLDVSASMQPHIQRIGDAAHQALRELADQDRVAIMVFDRSTRVRLPFRNSRDDVEREFESLLRQESFNGGTDITRGLLDAAKYVERNARREARRAIVIVTDDQTERNRDEEAVSRALTRADAVLMALIAPDAMQSGRWGGRRGGGGYPGGGGGYPGGGGGYPGGGGGYPGGGGWPGGGGMGGPLGGIILGRRGGYGGRGPYPGGGGGVYGPHTQSAGTAEIARRSGGDSLPVDDASALDETLARIRQRYALHFYVPQGAKPGEERNLELALSSAVRRRYPDAEVRYRRVYIVPDGTAPSDAPPPPDPAVVSQAPASTQPPAQDPDVPRLKRRPAVDDSGSGAPDGPITKPQSGGPRVDQPKSSDDTDTSPNRGSWRRVNPNEQQ